MKSPNVCGELAPVGDQRRLVERAPSRRARRRRRPRCRPPRSAATRSRPPRRRRRVTGTSACRPPPRPRTVTVSVRSPVSCDNGPRAVPRGSPRRTRWAAAGSPPRPPVDRRAGMSVGWRGRPWLAAGRRHRRPARARPPARVSRVTAAPRWSQRSGRNSSRTVLTPAGRESATSPSAERVKGTARPSSVACHLGDQPVATVAVVGRVTSARIVRCSGSDSTSRACPGPPVASSAPGAGCPRRARTSSRASGEACQRTRNPRDRTGRGGPVVDNGGVADAQLASRSATTAGDSLLIRSATKARPPASGEDSTLNMLATSRPDAQANHQLGMDTPVLRCSIP